MDPIFKVFLVTSSDLKNGFLGFFFFSLSGQNLGLWVGGSDGHERQLENGQLVAFDARHFSAAITDFGLFGYRAPPS